MHSSREKEECLLGERGKRHRLRTLQGVSRRQHDDELVIDHRDKGDIVMLCNWRPHESSVDLPGVQLRDQHPGAAFLGIQNDFRIGRAILARDVTHDRFKIGRAGRSDAYLSAFTAGAALHVDLRLIDAVQYVACFLKQKLAGASQFDTPREAAQ
jgi:hypothetical protein